MEILGLVLVAVGALIAIICAIWFIIEQFKTGILWGLACIFIPFVSLVWLVLYWEQGKRPFLFSLLAVVLLLGGLAVSEGLRQ